jgi:hypothetical protein
VKLFNATTNIPKIIIKACVWQGKNVFGILIFVFGGQMNLRRNSK